MSLRTSATLLSVGLPEGSVLGATDPTSTTSFHFGVGINWVTNMSVIAGIQQYHYSPNIWAWDRNS
eukprot:Nitzschia sp. Nitz4//scaffold42_size132992//104997//105295//NITZ4_003415-RA/size132992-snap-gene-0.78-mRNA-1//-1//CDS//3329551766//732//frame0